MNFRAHIDKRSLLISLVPLLYRCCVLLEWSLETRHDSFVRLFIFGVHIVILLYPSDTFERNEYIRRIKGCRYGTIRYKGGISPESSKYTHENHSAHEMMVLVAAFSQIFHA